MNRFFPVCAFFFLVAWLFGFFVMQSGIEIHLLLLLSIFFVMMRLHDNKKQQPGSTV
jgi:hypothetical protein